MNRIEEHPILGKENKSKNIKIFIDGKPFMAQEGEKIAAALLANGKSTFRYTEKENKPRGVYCGIGRCTDCIMTVNGKPNVRTCMTKVEPGMKIETQKGTGAWKGDNL